MSTDHRLYVSHWNLDKGLTDTIVIKPINNILTNLHVVMWYNKFTKFVFIKLLISCSQKYYHIYKNTKNIMYPYNKYVHTYIFTNSEIFHLSSHCSKISYSCEFQIKIKCSFVLPLMQNFLQLITSYSNCNIIIEIVLCSCIRHIRFR